MTPKKGKISPLKQAIYFLEGGAIVPNAYPHYATGNADNFTI